MNTPPLQNFIYPPIRVLTIWIWAMCLGGLTPIGAQDNGTNLEKLAAGYMADKEYSKAAELYEDLIKRNTHSVTYHDAYLKCLLEIPEHKKALKYIQKKNKSYPDNPALIVDHAWVLDKIGEPKKAEKMLTELIESPNIIRRNWVMPVAQALRKRKYTDQAIDLYLNIRKNTNNPMQYSMELSDLYAEKEDFTSLFAENLTYLEYYPDAFENLKKRLQLYLTEESHYQSLKIALVRKVQKHPGNTGFQELLTWTFVQQKDWSGALLQMKSLDLKTVKNGSKLYTFGQLCLQNEAYDVALETFDFIKNNYGKQGAYFVTASRSALQTRLLIIKKTSGNTQEKLKELASEFENFLEEKGHLPMADEARLDLAELYIHYMNQTQKGIHQLHSFIESNASYPNKIGKAKLLLADAYLIDGDEWEAHLLYKQVEKDFKDEPLGQEARLKFAQLSYYRGEFEWALTQLEVLRGATSQLISNNAIRLALHILEATGLDSTEEALESFAQIELLVLRNLTDSAMKQLQELNQKYTYHELSDNILFLKAQIALKQDNPTKAAELLQKIHEYYSYGLLADEALIKLGRLNEYVFNNVEKAMDCYEKILFNYSNSYYVFEARNRYRNLKANNPNL